ncbi:uncharacterized protein I303_101998 [Kwoniella dejecticola CBS 10117]|uniref:Uncharacterized protein n=1 Tax=Kwoniella dejecticola CBS 10117 TaxID=1296121 RepID=A0A1A6AC66_9TREE|nr:uncharacterized protein I303_01865 [Kwoniella dejecticola CBS 10117]OBR87657.1 hypothetical protein I303_01865 [Kwoniella dejecticola CBS 10117]
MSTRMLNLKIPSIPLSLFDDVDTLAITSSSFEKYQPGSWRLQIPPMKRLKKVVWVSDPSVRPKVEQKTHREWYKLNLWILAEMILVLPDVEFQVVNAGSTILKDPNYRYMSVTKRQKDAEQLVRLQVQQKSVGCQSYRSTCVRFVELREFRNNEEWAKWFSQDEMGRWDAISSELPV